MFSSDFEIECEEGKVISGVCKYCPEVEYNAFMSEAQTRNIKGFILKSVENFRYSITYIHRPTLARHVGTSISFHNWWKSKVAPNDAVVAESSSKKTSSKKTQPTVIESFMVSNTDHYTKLFRSVLFFTRRRVGIHKIETYCRTTEK